MSVNISYNTTLISNIGSISEDVFVDGNVVNYDLNAVLEVQAKAYKEKKRQVIVPFNCRTIR